MKIFLAVVCAATMLNLFSSCKKDEPSVTATIINTGPIAADGCGWMVEIDTVAYGADNLSDDFKINNLKVNLTYQTTNKNYQCGTLAGNLKPIIHIKHISKQ